MSGFTYEYDLDDANLLNEENIGNVERLSTQQQNQQQKAKELQRTQQRANTNNNKKKQQQQSQAVKSTAAAPTPVVDSKQPKIDAMLLKKQDLEFNRKMSSFKKAGGGGAQAGTHAGVDDDDDQEDGALDLKAKIDALMEQDNGIMSSDDDADEQLDLNAILGIVAPTTQSGSFSTANNTSNNNDNKNNNNKKKGASALPLQTVVAEDVIVPTIVNNGGDTQDHIIDRADLFAEPQHNAQTMGSLIDTQQQQQQQESSTGKHQQLKGRTLFSTVVKASGATSSAASAPAATASADQKKKGDANNKPSFAATKAPELFFDKNMIMGAASNNNNNNNNNNKAEVKLEADTATFDAATSAVTGHDASAAAAGAQKASSGRKLPPSISPQQRRTPPLRSELLTMPKPGEAPVTLRNVYWLDCKEIQAGDAPNSSGGGGGYHHGGVGNSAFAAGASASTVAGCVMLFGRLAIRESPTATEAVWRSICVRVPMQRCVLFLPKDQSEENDMNLLQEVTGLCRRRGIDERSFKFVKRRYAFEEPNVPTEESRWLKLRYSAAYPPLWAPNEQMPKHLQHVEAAFGVHRSLMELLMIKRRFEGAGFIDVTRATPVTNPALKRSHCDLEFTTESQKDVFVISPSDGVVQGLPAPPQLVAASLQLRTQLDATGKHHEIFAATIALTRFDTEASPALPPPCTPFMGIRQWDGASQLPFELLTQCAAAGLNHVRTFSSESQLVQWIFDKLREIDADIIIGHNIVGFSLGVLFNRYATLVGTGAHNTSWSNIGRMVWRQMPGALTGRGSSSSTNSSQAAYWAKEVTAGRLIVDTYTLAKEYHRTANYKLLSLAHELGLSGVFGPVLASHVDLPVRQLDKQLMCAAPTDLCSLLGQDYNFALLAAHLTHKLDFVPLTKRLAGIAGTIWSRVLNGSRAERIEYLLLHEFHRQKFVTPDKLRSTYNNNNNNNSNAAAPASAPTTGLQATRRARGGNAAAAAAVSAASEMPDGMGAGGNENDDDDDGDNEDGAAAGGGAGGSSSAAAPGSKAKYKGGRVLEPEVGLYRDYVLLLDFNSLYPSIIQEFNVCFSTVDRLKLGSAAAASGGGAVDRTEPTPPDRSRLICDNCRALPNAESLYPCPHRCILPRVIRGLVNGRKSVRALMKNERDPTKRAQLDIRQKAFKLTANSMYGCLGFQHSRFYAQKLAELITQEGRRALTSTVGIVNACDVGGGQRVRVVYGDTDSVMISTGEFENLQNVKLIAARIQAEVNKKYTKLELGLDGVFRTLLLHKKKKYAALTITDLDGAGTTYKQEVKGLEMVRRDWCRLSKDACKTVLDTALSTAYAADEEVVETIGAALEAIADSILAGKQPLANFVISKSIQRDPSAYRDAHTQPHVQVALRMQAKKQPVFPGDLIPYVICSQVYEGPTAAASGVGGAGGVTVKIEDAAAAPAGAFPSSSAANQQDGAAASSTSPVNNNKTIATTGASASASPSEKQHLQQEHAAATPPQQKTSAEQLQQTNNNSNSNNKTQKVAQQNRSLASRAWSEDEVNQLGLNIDAEWYLANQIFPPVMRLCEHINGFTPAFLCDKLRLSKSAVGLQENNNNNNNRRQYGNNRNQNGNNNANNDAFAVAFRGATLEDLHPGVPRFMVRCKSCAMVEAQLPHQRAHRILQDEIPKVPAQMGIRFRMASTFVERDTGKITRVPWFVCPNPDCKDPTFDPATVNNALEAQLHEAVRRYYSAVSSSSSSSHLSPHDFDGSTAATTPLEAYQRLVSHFSYLWRIFDVPPAPMTDKERTLWDQAARFVDGAGRFRTSEEVRRAKEIVARRIVGSGGGGSHYEHGAGAATIMKPGAPAELESDEAALLVAQSQVIGREVLQRVLAHYPCMLVDVSHVFGTAPSLL